MDVHNLTDLPVWMIPRFNQNQLSRHRWKLPVHDQSRLSSVNVIAQRPNMGVELLLSNCPEMITVICPFPIIKILSPENSPQTKEHQ